MTKNGITKWIIFSVCIIIIDLIIKYWLVQNYSSGQGVGLFNNAVLVYNIKSVNISSGFNHSVNPLSVINKIIQVLIFFVFIRALTLKTLFRLYKISLLFIVAGLAGNYIDMFLLADGNKNYQQLDYLNISILHSAFFNLSSLLCYFGWLLFVIAIIKAPAGIKKIFTGEKTAS